MKHRDFSHSILLEVLLAVLFVVSMAHLWLWVALLSVVALIFRKDHIVHVFKDIMTRV